MRKNRQFGVLVNQWHGIKNSIKYVNTIETCYYVESILKELEFTMIYLLQESLE